MCEENRGLSGQRTSAEELVVKVSFLTAHCGRRGGAVRWGVGGQLQVCVCVCKVREVLHAIRLCWMVMSVVDVCE
jgi:hypothetical protein